MSSSEVMLVCCGVDVLVDLMETLAILIPAMNHVDGSREALAFAMHLQAATQGQVHSLPDPPCFRGSCEHVKELHQELCQHVKEFRLEHTLDYYP
jgi:hypothetical protein